MASQVMDKTYRKALALDPSKFITDLVLSQHNILADVHKLSCPQAAHLTAKLYKLNIHGPGDFFKAHLDTPRGQDMMGSLVICLPHAFTGGELVVEHLGHKVSYAWGGQEQQDQDNSNVHWAFFYSDVQHEILPVISGHRITLTYNVFATPANEPPMQSVNLATNSFGQALTKALAKEDFLPNGGALGFSCHHLYPHTSEGFGDMMLKGVDAVIMTTAKQLGLDSCIEPVWKSSAGFCMAEEYEEEEGVSCGCQQCALAAGKVPASYAIGGKLQAAATHDYLDSEGMMSDGAAERLPKDYTARNVHSVKWVQKDFKFALALCGLAWGNEASLSAMYSAAAIIVKVPPAATRLADGSAAA
ncbi:hypothetical protein MMC07_002611 [Pseudocyphellaria aurata]|nr:hypothetical protein [Pseudocyphellaria aurata]